MDFERDDSGIRVHERGVIAQLCSLFRSHEQGLPEWFKNAAGAYARVNASTEQRVLTLFFGRVASGEEYIALLDHVGMTVEDLEQRFANWGDPDAHISDIDTEEIVEGGHGNGGKCYMTQMFTAVSYLHTVRGGRGSRYGFVGDDPHPGWFPDKKQGRGFPVARASDELKRVLTELGIDLIRLPEEVRTAVASSDGFTLVVGIGPKQFRARDHFRSLVENIVHHPQMVITTKTNRIFVVDDGRSVSGMCPVTLEEIEPHEFAPEPKMIPIPEQLRDPVSGDLCATGAPGSRGRLILRTSKRSMRRKLRGRHHITYFAHGRPRGFKRMENISRSAWADKMYGECYLDAVADFETPDRSHLSESPLTRALEEWVKLQVLAYEEEFRSRERLEASQEERNKLSELNRVLDKWKNEFLDEASFGAGAQGRGPGTGRRTPRRALPAKEPVQVSVRSPYQKAGVGVWLKIRPRFVDSDGIEVQPPAYQWFSSDWAVATVDNNSIVTHTPGEVDLWLETVDRKLRSNHVNIRVLDTVSATVDPESIEIKAGQVQQLTAMVTDREKSKHTDVFMTWLQDDSSVVGVTASGKIIGRKPGITNVYPVDDRCVATPNACRVSVVPAEGVGDKEGKAYPQILLSEIDPDPLNPDGETVHLSPEDGPVHQPTPQHVENNIWWINLQCPLAKFYFRAGAESPEWRSYHVERLIEALVKIRLAMDFQVADEELTFDEVERKWREVAAEVQKRALEELRPILEGEEVSSDL